jgi:hypothetical protein
MIHEAVCLSVNTGDEKDCDCGGVTNLPAEPPVQPALEVPMTLEEQIKAAQQGNMISQSPSKRTRRHKGPPVEDPMSGSEPDGNIYRAVHVYLRDGESDQQVKTNGMREARAAGPGTVVFTHHHVFGDECFDACKVKVVSD